MLKRFSVSIEKELIRQFDSFVKRNKFANRSQAIRHLIKQELVTLEWQKDEIVAGTLTLVYDHHEKELVQKILAIQHDFSKDIISSQHIHLDHHNCLEIVAVKGKVSGIRELLYNFKAVKGLKHAAITAATTGVKI